MQLAGNKKKAIQFPPPPVKKKVLTVTNQCNSTTSGNAITYYDGCSNINSDDYVNNDA